MLYPALSVTAEVLLVVLSPGDASLTLRKNPTTVHLTDLLNATCRFSFPAKLWSMSSAVLFSGGV